MAQRHSARSVMWPWLLLALGIAVADQATKTLILMNFQLGDSTPVTSWLNIVRWHNAGAAFSFLANASGWQRYVFIGIALVAVGVILWLLRSHGGQKLFAFALACILGGAVGNVVDRMLHGYVVDFIQVRLSLLEPIFRGGYFPSFNVADAAITVGAVGLIVDELRRVRQSR
jgi:signal peptidase II